MLGTVRRGADLAQVDPAVVADAVALDQQDPAAAIRAYAPEGVYRVVEVSLSDNADLDNAVVANGAVIAAYATRADRTGIPFWNLLFSNVVLRLIGSDSTEYSGWLRLPARAWHRPGSGDGRRTSDAPSGGPRGTGPAPPRWAGRRRPSPASRGPTPP